jgi:uncharacterized protein YuzE
MNYVYDPEADALYVTVEAANVDHQEEMGDGVVIDVTVEGDVVGVDVMNPSSGWDPEKVIARYGLRDSEAEFLRRLAVVKSWSPLRRRNATSQTSSGQTEPDPLVESLA